MNEGDLLKVLKELRVYTKTRNKVISKDAGCQTDLPEPDNNNNLPLFYCCQFSSSGDVETQCDIPLLQDLCKSCGKTITVESVATQCDLLKKIPVPIKNIPFANKIEKGHRIVKCQKGDGFITLSSPVIRRPCKEISVIQSGDKQIKSVSLEEEVNTDEARLDLTANLRRDDRYTVGNLKNRETSTGTDKEPENDRDHEDHSFEPMDDDDENPDEKPAPKKRKVSDIVEEEKQFWADMKKQSKRIKLSSKTKNRYKKNGSLKNGAKIEIHLPGSQGQIKEERKLETRDSDWLTDNEEDDDDMSEDITMAFKAEWKQNRKPAHYHAKNYVCEVCNRPYSKSRLLREHIVRDHSDHDKAKEFPFRCHHCKRVYNGQRQLDHHQSLHNGPCEICGMMFGCSALFWNHRKNHDAVCDICNKSFASVNSMSAHKQLKHGKKKYFCNICDKGFFFKCLLRLHNKKSHSWVSSKKRPCEKTPLIDLNCGECSYVAKNEQSLRVHQGMAHRRKKRSDTVYNCGVCDAKLKTKASLKKHLDKHLTAYSSIKCNVCNRVFPTEKKLDCHRKRAHGLPNDDEETQELQIISGEQDICSCTICGSTYDTTFSLQEHMISEHSLPKKINIANNQIVYECAYCNSSFDSTSSLQTHILSVHSVSHTSQVTSESLHVTSAVEEYPVMEISLSNREVRSPENRIISEAFEIPVETSIGNFDTSNAVSLPASAVPPGVSTVEIDGVKYHVIRNGQ